ncbi:PGN_0703 family putative restriction endonuclease [Pedococcus sp. 2YAF34]|uniref:PGN_0703 family putative restriction endonuclease n=1 Tax=Pedococcus sp. 2YAF34 TaxID=3233032 RepID=UPI003F9C9016
MLGLEYLEDACTPSHALHGIEAEWFPPRELHTADQSGFDIAAYLVLSDGQRLLVTVEVKYTDSFSAKKMTWERYAAHLQAAGLAERAMQDIVRAGGSQFLRSVSLTDSLRRRGVRSGPGVGRVLAVVLGRGDDKSARAVVNKITEYRPSTPVAFWSHENFPQACSREPELAEWSQSLKRRYVLPVGGSM